MTNQIPKEVNRISSHLNYGINPKQFFLDQFNDFYHQSPYKNNIKPNKMLFAMEDPIKAKPTITSFVNQINSDSCLVGNSDFTDILWSSRMAEEEDIHQISDDENPHFFLNQNPMDNLMDLFDEVTKKPPQSKAQKPKKGKKNSNVIKKMGRIILNNIKKYEIPNRANPGIINMLEKLQNRFQKKRIRNMVDGFNISHLQALYDIEEEWISKHNLKITRQIFTRQLRGQVLKSFQIKTLSQKLLYLNTLKCSSLRLMSQTLAKRLQTSENQQ